MARTRLRGRTDRLSLVVGSAYGRMVRTVAMEGPGGGWRVLVPHTRRERRRGLRGHPPPGPREALLLRRCRVVHTFGMAAPIAVVFLDGSLEVVGVQVARPRRLIRPRRGARHVLECDARSELRIGDRFRSARPAGR